MGVFEEVAHPDYREAVAAREIEDVAFPEELELATVLHALSDPIRLRILARLASGEECSCGSFGLPVTKSTCSHHFRVLREAGIISTRVEGKTRLNRLRREALERR